MSVFRYSNSAYKVQLKHFLFILMYVSCVHLVHFVIQTNRCSTYIYIYIYSKYCYTFRYLIKPEYSKHQHSDYTYQTVQTVHTANKLTNSKYCNDNSWQLTMLWRLHFIITHAKKLIYWFYSHCNLNDFYNFSKADGLKWKMMRLHWNM